MASLSTAIMAHPDRKKWVPALEKRLDSPEVIWDQKGSRWDTGRRALLAHDPDATHHLVVQDDAVLSKNLLNSCRRLIKYSGDYPVDLYMGRSSAGFRRKANKSHVERSPWFLAAGPRWGVAVIIPVAHIADLVSFCDRDTTSDAYDGKMSLYYFRKKKSCLYTIPSLVNHREVGENPSLVAGRHANRTAYVYDGKSAINTDWSISPDPNPARMKARFRNVDTGHKRIVNRYDEIYEELKMDKEWELM